MNVKLTPHSTSKTSSILNIYTIYAYVLSNYSNYFLNSTFLNTKYFDRHVTIGYVSRLLFF